MPRVPEYQRTQITSDPGPALQAQGTPPIEAFGGGQAAAGFQGARNAFGAVTEVISEQKKLADDTMTMSAYTQALTAKNQSLYDPSKGVMNLRGANAMAGAESAREDFKKQLGSIEENLQNDDQRMLFQKIRARVGEDFDGTLERHVYGEAQKFSVEKQKAAVQAAMDDATLNYFQPGKIQESLTVVKDLAKRNAEAQGLGELSPEIEKQAGSALYSKVLDRMIATEDPRAQGYYLGVQGDMTAEDRERIDKVMKVSNAKIESTKQADEIGRAHPDLGSALRAARELPAGEVRDQTISRIKDYHADLKLADDTRDRLRVDQAAEIIQKSQGQAELTPQMLAGLKPSQIRELQEFRKQQRTGMTAEVNSDQYLNMLKMSAQDPGGFRNVNLGEMRSQIAPGQLSELAKMQVSMRTGQHSSQAAGARSTQGIINGNLNSMGLSRSRDGEEVKRYEDEVYRRAQEQSAELKRPLEPKEIQSIADTLAVKVNDGWLSSQRMFQLDQNDPVDVSVRNIPPSELREIRQALRQFKRPETDENVLDLFNKGLVNFRGR